MIISIEHYYVYLSESFHIFHRMFYNMPKIIFKYSMCFSRTFPRMFNGVPRNVWQYSPEYLAPFLGMFNCIPGDVWEQSVEYLATFPGILEDIPPIPRVPHISFPVPVLLVSYRAAFQRSCYKKVCWKYAANLQKSTFNTKVWFQ